MKYYGGCVEVLVFVVVDIVIVGCYGEVLIVFCYVLFFGVDLVFMVVVFVMKFCMMVCVVGNCELS